MRGNLQRSTYNLQRAGGEGVKIRIRIRMKKGEVDCFAAGAG
jgi:hypothetical protein